MRARLWVIMTAGAGVLAGCGLAAASVDDAANPARIGAWKLTPEIVSLNVAGQTIGRDQLSDLGSRFGDGLDDGPFGSSLGRERTASCYEPGANPETDIRKVLNRRLIKDCTVTDQTAEGNTRRAVMSCPYDLYGDEGTASIATTANLDADKATTEIRISLSEKTKTGATKQMTMRFEVKAERMGDCGSA